MRRGARRALVAVASLVALPAVAHALVLASTRIEPPRIAPIDATPVVESGGIARLHGSYTRLRAGIREVYLEGSPEAIGAAHGRLLHDAMIDDERDVWRDLDRAVPSEAARTLLLDLGRVRYRHVDRGVPEPRLRELAAEAQAFAPDPYADRLGTFHRFVLLHTLYDIALGFERSPLIGCSSFVLGPGATKDGHTLLARAFDFEGGDAFDRGKAVFFVREDGAIPFASVAWPGLVGVVSGMNAEGVAIVVHGARAGEPRAEGEPVVFALREVLERAHDANEAVAILKAQDVMVAHLVLVADARGESAIVERAPGETSVILPRDPDRVALSNHFAGPLAADPRNEVVRAKTTTLARRARLDELLGAIGPHEADVPRAVAMLRDHECADGAPCPLGDRRAIDALIATHGIVADTTDRVLWVSAGPHLSGELVRFDLKEIFAPGHDPAKDAAPVTLAADPILADGRYAAARARTSAAGATK